MFLNLVYKSLKADVVLRRVKAFVKRLLQVTCGQMPPFICGTLYLLSELLKVKPELRVQLQDHVVYDTISLSRCFSSKSWFHKHLSLTCLLVTWGFANMLCYRRKHLNSYNCVKNLHRWRCFEHPSESYGLHSWREDCFSKCCISKKVNIFHPKALSKHAVSFFSWQSLKNS